MNNSHKYNWLFELLFKNPQGITFGEINRRWMNSLFSDGNSIPKRTFHHWLNQIEESFDVNICCDRTNNRYFIDSSTINYDLVKFKLWVFNSLTQADLFSSCTQLKDRIMYEEVYSDSNLLIQITNAMKQHHTLMMTYDGFSEDKKYTKEIQPHALKKFKQRWYVIVITVPEGKRRSYALDRISKLEHTGHSFEFDPDYDVKKSFEFSYGMYSSDDAEPVNIRLRLNESGRNYMRSLPLHHSQKEIETTNDYSIFTMTLCPSFDFIQALLDFEDQLEVLEPQSLRNDIKEIINKMRQLYD